MSTKAAILLSFIFVIGMISSSSSLPAQTTRYVDDDAPLGGNGSSWPTAYKYLQDALAVSADGDEIRIAGGIYKPDQDEGGSVTPGDRGATFQLIHGVTIQGGYAGLADPGNPDQRDIALFKTTLSGDLNGDDGPNFQNYAENSYHVVTGPGTIEWEAAVLDGVTMTAGNTDGGATSEGGGMLNPGGNPILIDCTFDANYAYNYGGGMRSYDLGGPYATTLNRCTFINNKAEWGGGGGMCDSGGAKLTNCTFISNTADWGGGMWTAYGSNPTLKNCTFSNNVARHWMGYGGGGGICNWGSSPIVIDCKFIGNTAEADIGGGMSNLYQSSPILTNCVFINNMGTPGGGMGNDESSPTLTNCLFFANSASRGAGMYNIGQSCPTLTNCTFSENSATGNGGGMSCWNSSDRPALISCILWGNVDDSDGSGGGPYTDESAQIHGASHRVSFSCIQGLIPGGDFDNGTNIGTDPLFVTGPGGDYYLSQIAAGQTSNSPCVDAGISSLGTTRTDSVPDDIDMGYHYPLTAFPGGINPDRHKSLAGQGR